MPTTWAAWTCCGSRERTADAPGRDTSVIVKAVRNFNGASAALIQEAVRQRVALLVSTPLWLEYEAVVKRTEHWVWPGFGAEQAERFLDVLANAATPVEIQFRWRGLLPDPDDDMVLETAINGGADALVTFNEQDFAPAVAALDWICGDRTPY